MSAKRSGCLVIILFIWIELVVASLCAKAVWPEIKKAVAGFHLAGSALQ